MSTALKRARDWKPRFLEELAKRGNLTAAARVVDVDRTTVWKHRNSDPAFDEAYLHALDTAADLVELEILKRAAEGDTRTKTETVVDAEGKVVSVKTTTETFKSDVLLIFQAKALRPEKYRDNYDLKSWVAAIASAHGPSDGDPVGVAKAPGRKRPTRNQGS